MTSPSLLERLQALEDQAAIRRLMARYMELCDHLDADTPMDALGDLFTEDAEWAGKGERYGQAFGGHHGRAAIVAMLDTYRGRPPHFTFNAHFLTSEMIEASGDQASGAWMMLQTSTFASGASFLTAARLSVAFRREAERWRIHRFATANLFSRPVDAWNTADALPTPSLKLQPTDLTT